MPMHVVNSAQLVCSFGTSPSVLVVLPVHREEIQNQFAANIMDYIPMTNIMPFGMCMSLANPQVAAATSAAQGVLTPQPASRRRHRRGRRGRRQCCSTISRLSTIPRF